MNWSVVEPLYTLVVGKVWIDKNCSTKVSKVTSKLLSEKIVGSTLFIKNTQLSSVVDSLKIEPLLIVMDVSVCVISLMLVNTASVDKVIAGSLIPFTWTRAFPSLTSTRVPSVAKVYTYAEGTAVTGTVTPLKSTLDTVATVDEVALGSVNTTPKSGFFSSSNSILLYKSFLVARGV